MVLNKFKDVLLGFLQFAGNLIVFLMIVFIFFHVLTDIESNQYHILYEFLQYMLKVITLNLGMTATGKNISFFIIPAMGRSLLLFLPSVLIALYIAYRATRSRYLKKNTLLTKFIKFFSIITTSVPIYWFAFSFFFIAIKTGWFPVGGISSPSLSSMNLFEKAIDLIHHLILPIFSLMIFPILILGKAMENRLDDLSSREYVRTMKALGFSDREIFKERLRRPLLIELLKQLSSSMPLFISYLIFIEIVYTFNGLGYYALESGYSIDRDISWTAFVYLGIFSLVFQFISQVFIQVLSGHREARNNREHGLKISSILSSFPLLIGSVIILQPFRNSSVDSDFMRIILFLISLILLAFLMKRPNKNPSIESPVLFKLIPEAFFQNTKGEQGPRGKFFPLILLVLVGAVFYFISWFVEPGFSIDIMQPPSSKHILGTDGRGWDLFLTLLVSLRYTIIPLGAGLAGFLVGLILAVAGGLLGESLLDRIVENIEMFPSVLIYLMIIQLVTPLTSAMFVTLFLLSTIRIYRLFKREVFQLSSEKFFLYSHSIGAGIIRSSLIHILPNLRKSLMSELSMLLVEITVLETNFRSLGRVGTDLPLFSVPGLGFMIAENKSALIRGQWWLWLFPTLILILYLLYIVSCVKATARMMEEKS